MHGLRPSIDPSSDGDVPDGAYINRCINGSFTPGSIFKLITSAAAIENIKDIDSRRFTCAGQRRCGRRDRQVHGRARQPDV